MPDRVLVYRRDLFKTTENFITQQALALGAEVVCAGTSLHGPPPPGLPHVLLPNPLTDRRRVTVLSGVDVVNVHFAVDIPPARRIARLLDVPLVATLHGFDVTRTTRSCLLSGRPNLLRYGATRRRLLQTPDLLLAVSSYIRERAIAHGAPADRVVVHHMGTDLRNLAAARVDGPARDEGFTIVHVARLVEKKGTRYLIEAVARLRQTCPNIRLKIVGDGPLRARLERHSRTLGVEDDVDFLGALGHRQTLEVLAGGHVLVLPSVVAANGDAEGLGMVMLEAAGLGVPLVVSDSGGITDFVDGRTGVIVPPGNSMALAAALDDVRRDPESGRARARHALDRLRSDFDAAVQARRLGEVLDRVIATYRGRTSEQAGVR